MSFLAPLFLLGALAVGLPVLFHLIRRSVKDRTIFSSLIFLSPSPPRLTRRSRLEHLLLLALRCAVLCLLAIGFARPFLKRAFPESQSAEAVKRVVVLLDTSASMRRPELWNAARAKAEGIARTAKPGDAVALFTFDRQVKSLISFDEWSETTVGDRTALAVSRLGEAKPGWGSTAMDSALTQAAELFGDREKDEGAGIRQVIVISDFQEGSRLAALQGYDWPKDVQVIQERISPRAANNASLHLLTDQVRSGPASESAIRVQVSNASDSKAEQFRVGWAEARDAYNGTPVSVYVPAGQSRVISIATATTNLPTGRILLTGDDEAFDNSVWVIPPDKSHVTVIYLGGDTEDDVRQPLFFLRQALQDTPRQVIRVERLDASAPIGQAHLDQGDLFVVNASVTDAQAAQLRQALAQGKTLLMLPTTAEAGTRLGKIVDAERSRGTLDPTPGLTPASEQKLNGYAMLTEIDFGHPLFAPFADPRFSDFTKIHVWNYRKMDFSAVTNAQILARFDTGDPAIVSIPAGKGNMFVFTSGWHPQDSQLGLSSKFVPLLYSLLELSSAAPPRPEQYFVGAALPAAPANPNASTPTLQLPGGSKVMLKPGETNYTALEPGIYSIAGGTGTNQFAVNLEPSESRTAPGLADSLERLGVPGPVASSTAGHSPETKVRLQNAELEAHQKLWRWLIVATLLVVGIETWLAGWTKHRAATREVVT